MTLSTFIDRILEPLAMIAGLTIFLRPWLAHLGIFY